MSALPEGEEESGLSRALHAVEKPIAGYPEILTVEDVCRILRVKKSWCYNDHTLLWFKTGRLKRILRKDLLAHIESQRHKTLCDNPGMVASFDTDEVMD